MTLEELKILEDLANKTSKLPWVVQADYNQKGYVVLSLGNTEFWSISDFEFAAAAHNSFSELIELAKRGLESRRQEWAYGNGPESLEFDLVEEDTPTVHTPDFWRKYAGL